MSKKNKKINTDNDMDNLTAAAEAAAEAAAALEEEMAADQDKTEADGEADDRQDPRDARIRELEDKTIRQMAEFDNYRKRTEKEKSEMFDIGMKNMIEKILPVVDNFERGIAAAEESGETTAFFEGMNMVYKQLMKVLEDAGVTAIDAVGKEFDPNFHNAVMHEEDDSGRENIVTVELQKGYMYKDSLIRPSMVKVLN